MLIYMINDALQWFRRKIAFEDRRRFGCATVLPQLLGNAVFVGLSLRQLGGNSGLAEHSLRLGRERKKRAEKSGKEQMSHMEGGTTAKSTQRH